MCSHLNSDHNTSQKDDLSENINHLLKKLFHEHLLTLNEKFHHLNLFDGQQRIIFHLLHHEGDYQSNIAKKHNIKRATVNKAISSMEEKGLLFKVKDESKKRAFKLFLTEKGLEMKKPIIKKIQEMQEVILDGFSDEEQTKLRDFLGRMIDNLHNHRKAKEQDHEEGKMIIKVKIEKEE